MSEICTHTKWRCSKQLAPRAAQAEGEAGFQKLWDVSGVKAMREGNLPKLTSLCNKKAQPTSDAALKNSW